MPDLKMYSEQQLEAELASRKAAGRKFKAMTLKFAAKWPKSPRGIWRVTTEGDCEGKSTAELGCYEGHVVDIAMMLAPKCYYSLKFEPGKPMEAPKKVKPKEVQVSLNIDSGTWDWPVEDRAVRMNEWLQLDFPSHSVVVEPGQYFASVKLVPVP